MHTSLNCKLNLKVLNQAFGLKIFCCVTTELWVASA